MEQLLLHLVGDYITQTDWMANNKTKKLRIAFIHALIYALPFMLLSPSVKAWLVIMLTHAIIDHYRLAKYLVFAKNWLTNPELRWVDCHETGYHQNTPPWLSVWLLIIADNIMHLIINYSALRWL